MNTARLSLALVSWLALTSLALAANPAPKGAAADADIAALRSALHANRKAVVAVNLQLTDAEATAFWPVYDRYQKELNAIGDRLVAVIDEYAKNFKTLTDDQAKKLVDDYLSVEADRASVRRDWADDFAAVLTGRKLMRFYQIENKIDAVLRYELAAQIPVVDEPPATPK